MPLKMAIYSVREHTDDGYHFPIPEDLKHNKDKILNLIHQTTGNNKFYPGKWYQIKRFQVPMPD